LGAQLAHLLALVSRGNERQAKVTMFEVVSVLRHYCQWSGEESSVVSSITPCNSPHSRTKTPASQTPKLKEFNSTIADLPAFRIDVFLRSQLSEGKEHEQEQENTNPSSTKGRAFKKPIPQNTSMVPGTWDIYLPQRVPETRHSWESYLNLA
jgi:hypothetical protein